MKQSDFEDILQQAANEFNPTVSDGLYKGILKKQADLKRKNKRLLFYSLVSLVALSATIVVAFWVNNTITQTPNVLAENNTINNQNTQNKAKPVVIVKQTTTINQTKITLTKRKSNTDNKGKQLTTNKADRGKKAAFETHQTSQHINSSSNNKSKQLSVSKTNKTADFASNTPIKKRHELNSNKPITKLQVITTDNKLIADSKIITKQIATAINTTNIIENKIISSDSLVQPKPILMAHADTVINFLTPQSKHNKWGLLVSGAFQPIAKVKNTAASLPPKFYDSLGLSQNGKLGLGINISMLHQFTPQFCLLFGVGYQQVNFETIRAVNVNIDSTEMLLANNKFYDASNTHFILDTRLSWIELPIQLQYKTTAVKQLSSYVQGGIALQKIIAQKGISINQDAKGLATLTSTKNVELNRFSSLQMAILFETGMQYRLNKHMSLQLGVVYKQQLINHYKNSYTKEQPGFYIGILPSFKFIF